ncbi:MAG: TraB/GumN family protein [Desulfobacterales bacterium]|nr:TraB/GumN family protein [Desulfobacterales bacterium]MBF0395312.1 TraB/GumN family protein [Desulfobacterales bacterium]
MNNNNMIHYLNFEDKTIILVGTAHVSQESANLVKEVIETEKPDTVCVELCQSRFQTIRQKDRWQDTDIIKIIKEKKALLLLMNLLLSSFQKRIAEKFNIKPGEEMITAIDTAEKLGAAVHLADRDVRITLSKTWKMMGFRDKVSLLYQFLMSVGEIEEITQEDIEKMKQEDVIETLLADVGKTIPALKTILIDERDKYLTFKIRTAPGKKIVAVVGAGHVNGIKKYWNDEIDINKLEEIPPKSKISEYMNWLIPMSICLLFVGGFFFGGANTGAKMLTWWALITGALSGLGALIAIPHPLTFLSAVLSAPLTTLHPLIAAGWVSGLVEAFLRKPKVKDFENLPEDIFSLKGFWRNKVTRILLVVVFTNLGASIGTFVALPMMIKFFK